MNTIQSLKNGWRINEDLGFVTEQIKDRCNSEDNYAWAKGYPIIKSEDISGKLGKPLLDLEDKSICYRHQCRYQKSNH